MGPPTLAETPLRPSFRPPRPLCFLTFYPVLFTESVIPICKMIFIYVLITVSGDCSMAGGDISSTAGGFRIAESVE